MFDIMQATVTGFCSTYNKVPTPLGRQEGVSEVWAQLFQVGIDLLDKVISSIEVGRGHI